MGSAFSKTDSKGREKVKCELCSEYHHRLDVHISKKHGILVKDYNEKFPGAPTISAAAQESARAGQKVAAARRAEAVVEGGVIPTAPTAEPTAEKALDEIRCGVVTLKIRKDLSAADAARIPPHDEHWHPGKREREQIECLALGIANTENVFIYGPTGCGKTTSVEELAAMVRQPYVRVQANRKLTVEDFVGQQGLAIVEGKQVTVWKDGVLPQAMRAGWWLMLDEICGAEAGVLLRLQAVLEGRPLILTENGGEVVQPHPNFRIIATDNTNGRGDNSGMYAGTNVMNEATLDRFGVVIKADYPDRDTEQKILMEKSGVDADTARKMVEVALRVREALENETCYCTFSTRRLIAWSKKAVQLKDVRRAARISVTNKLTADDAKFVDGLIQRYFGGEV